MVGYLTNKRVFSWKNYKKNENLKIIYFSEMATGGASATVHGFSDDSQCSICIKGGQHKETKAFCKDCEGYICSSCMDSHGNFPTLRNHKITPIEEMKKQCGICKSKGKQKDARCFCKNCDAWICDNCKESHENFRELQKHTIVTKDDLIRSESSAPSEISTRLEKLSTKPSHKPGSETKLSDESSRQSGSETKPQAYGENTNGNLQTKPSEYVTAKSLAKASTDSLAAEHDNIDILHYSTIKKIKEIDIKVSGDKKNCSITGCCFMSRDALIACDWNNHKIKLLDRSLSVVDSIDLTGRPWDVAAVDNNSVIVTMPDEKQLQFIQVLPSRKRGRTIDVDEKCWGVAVAADKIFISCYRYNDKVGDIRVYVLEGRDLGKRLGINPDGSNMFRCPQYVAVSRSGDKIFVSDWDTNTVSCLTSGDNLVYQYRDKELEWPYGLLVDDNDNVIVCGWDSNTVQVITSAGEKHKTLLSKKDGIYRPRCVGFRPSDGTLVVGCRWRKTLVFRMA